MSAATSQGPLDSTIADPHGHFRFRFHADTTALYLLSARYGGIEYFSSPVHTNPERPDTTMRVLVYDTSSTAPVVVEARHLVVPRPSEDGSRARARSHRAPECGIGRPRERRFLPAELGRRAAGGIGRPSSR